MNATAEKVQFKNDHHKEVFEEMIGNVHPGHSPVSKREQAVSYLISAMSYPNQKELFHPLARFPELDKAIELYQDGTIGETDATLFALAMNLHNGQDVLKDFGILIPATPYHFHCKLKSDVFLMGEAFIIHREGYGFNR